MIRGFKQVAMLIALIFVARIFALWVTVHSSHLHQVVEREFDPAIMFYTESDDVLKAEKQVNRQIKEIKPPS